MLTKIKNTHTSYISRLLVLPLLIFVFAAFTLKAKEIGADKKIKKSVEQLMNKITGSKNTDAKFDSELTRLKNVYTGKRITVVIDAGHGGADNGAINKDGIFEKDITLQLIKKIDALNTNQNINIILSRAADIYSDPKQKAAFAKDKNADLFISVHLDGNPKNKWNTVSGMSVFVAKNEITNSKKSKELASAILNSFKSNYDLLVPTFITQRQSGIYVIQANDFPSVLIEAGYLTNDQDLAYLQSKKGQETFAKNVLDGITKYALQMENTNQIIQKKLVQDTLYYFNGKQINKSDLESQLAYKTIDVKWYKSAEAASKFKTNNNEIVVELFGRNDSARFLKKESVRIDTPRIVFTKTEIEPEFPGGKDAWRKYLQENLDGSIAVKEKLQAGYYTFITKFIVHEDGSLSQISHQKKILMTK